VKCSVGCAFWFNIANNWTKKEGALTLNEKQQTIHKVLDVLTCAEMASHLRFATSTLRKIMLTTDKILEVEINMEVSCTLLYLS
jgi:hypothetical protein